MAMNKSLSSICNNLKTEMEPSDFELVGRSVDELVQHILWGDIDEMPNTILGDLITAVDTDDTEAHVRAQCAASIIAWHRRRLCKGGWYANQSLGPMEDEE